MELYIFPRLPDHEAHTNCHGMQLLKKVIEGSNTKVIAGKPKAFENIKEHE